jgi:hypothetical protein
MKNVSEILAPLQVNNHGRRMSALLFDLAAALRDRDQATQALRDAGWPTSETYPSLHRSWDIYEARFDGLYTAASIMCSSEAEKAAMREIVG